MEQKQNKKKSSDSINIMDNRKAMHIYSTNCYPSYQSHNDNDKKSKINTYLDTLKDCRQNRNCKQLSPYPFNNEEIRSRNSRNSSCSRDKLTVHDAKCYLVTCMDFRLLDYVVKFMDDNGLNTNYDQFILAGASLGFTQEKYPHWTQSLLDHMSIGSTLHHFRQIIFIDHTDCGAYKKFYPQIKNCQQQKKYHQIHMQRARDNLAIKFPNFKFTGYLMNLQGQCQNITVNQQIIYTNKQIKQNTNLLNRDSQKCELKPNQLKISKQTKTIQKKTDKSEKMNKSQNKKR